VARKEITKRNFVVAKIYRKFAKEALNKKIQVGK